MVAGWVGRGLCLWCSCKVLHVYPLCVTLLGTSSHVCGSFVSFYDHRGQLTNLRFCKGSDALLNSLGSGSVFLGNL